MKKILTYLLVAVMFVSSFAACGKETAGNEETNHLKKAAEYIYAMYKDKGTSTAIDFERTAQVMIGTSKFAVEWTTDNDAVKVTTNGTMATIDVDERSETEVKYTLTATVKDAEGNTESVSFNYVVPKWEGFIKIVEEAYKLESGAAMEGSSTLEGTITKIDTAWSDDYKNITVIIAVPGIEDKPIMCYRLTAANKDDANQLAQVAGLAVGDYITVTGTIKNYNGTIEFDAGCTLDALVKGEGNPDTPEVPATPEDVSVPAGATAAAIVDLAYTLEVDQKFAAPCTLTGVISEVNTAWSDQYKNITVTIVVDGKEDKKIECFRLVGDGAADLAVGDTITVTGTMKNYKGKIEFDAKCNLDNVVKAAGSDEPVEETDLVINFADLIDGGYGYSAIINGDVVDVTIESQYQEIQYILPEVVDLAAYTTLIVDVTSNAQLDIKLVDPNAELNEYSQKAPFLDNYTAEGQAITEPIIIDLTVYADKDLSQINFMAMGNDTAFTIKSITFTTEAVATTPTITAADLFDAAKVIEVATNMADDYTFAAVLKGTVAEINTEYSEQHGNITITINVDGTDKTFYCYRLKGEGVATLAVGDAVAIVGTISKYKGAPQFGAGSLLIPADAFESVQAAVAAYALATGEFIENKTITGVVAEVKTAYSEQYGNVTVTLVPAGLDTYIIECFRMKGDIAATVAAGDVITVTGKLLNYNGKIEFDAGCVGVLVAGAEAPATAEKLELNANDVAAGAIETAVSVGGFNIVGTADAAVTVDSNSKKGDNGLEFTQRIKLGGTGSLEKRHISFTTTGAAKITVYAMSSSSGEDRPLLLLNADGTEIGRGTTLGKVDDSTIPALTFEVTEAGTYYLWSEKSGINVYYVSVE